MPREYHDHEHELTQNLTHSTLTVTLLQTKLGNMVRSDACSRHGHVGLHMDTTENGVDSDKTWCGQCAKLGRLLPSPSKTRRHSHIVNESIWSQISLPIKGVRRNAVIFLMGAVAMYMVSHALVSLATTQQSTLNTRSDHCI